jgi:hypothetical protein
MGGLAYKHNQGTYSDWWQLLSTVSGEVKQQLPMHKRTQQVISLDRINKHAHIQSSNASIDAAQSENKHLENKKEGTRGNKDRTCTPRKHHSSGCLDSNFQSKILGKPWQNFCRSHISEKQPKSAKPQGKQTTQAVVATTPKTDSNATNKPHDGKYTSPQAGDHSPGSTKIQIRPTVNSNSATVNSNSATVYIKYFQKRAKKVQKSVAQSCDLAEIRTRVTSFADYRYTAGTLNQTPMQRKGEMPDSMIQNNSIYNHGKAGTSAWALAVTG